MIIIHLFFPFTSFFFMMKHFRPSRGSCSFAAVLPSESSASSVGVPVRSVPSNAILMTEKIRLNLSGRIMKDSSLGELCRIGWAMRGSNFYKSVESLKS